MTCEGRSFRSNETGDFKKTLVKFKSPKLMNQEKLFVRAKSYGTVKGKILEGDWSDVKKVKIIKSKKKN